MSAARPYGRRVRLAGYIAAWRGSNVNYALIPLAVVLFVCMVWGGHVFASQTSQIIEDGKLSRDTLFTSGATILGLVVIGSLDAIRN